MRIMIVDDEEILIKGFYNMLPWEKHGMVICADASNGREALEVLSDLNKNPLSLPDVIITDIKMPIMDGIELTAALKERYPQLPVIVLSNHDDYGNVRTAMKCGAKDYLLKAGLSPSELKDYLVKLQEEMREAEKEVESEKDGKVIEEGDGGKDRNKNIGKILEYINEHYEDKEITLTFLANKFFIQKNYLCTIFKQKMNMTLTDYIVSLRMKKAKTLMRTTNLSITEIAEKVSYTDLSYFNRLFRKENGISPREYVTLIRG